MTPPIEAADAARAVGADASAEQRFPLGLTLILAAVTGLAPFSIQVIAPGLPAIARALDASQGAIALLISLATLSIALGAIVYGPLADHYGRRPVMLGGLALCVIGALVAAVSPGLELTLVGRVAQCVGAGAGMVLARAVARDLYGREGSAAMIARITALMVVAPMLAPTLGGIITEWAGWRAVFVSIAALAGVTLFFAYRALPETLATPSPRLDLRSVASDYRLIIGRSGFFWPAITVTFSISTFFCFVSGAPYAMERAFGLSAAEYGLLFILIAGSFMASNFASPRVARELGAERAILLGMALSAVAATIGGVALALGGGWIGWLMLAAIGNAVGAGFALPQALALSVSAAPERAGSASGLVSVMQFSAAAVAVQIAALTQPERPWTLALLMAGLAACATASAWRGARSVDPIRL